MALFHVFVDGPADRSAEGMKRLAEAMSQRYGLPAGELVARLTRGRFRVKANIDQPTADAYARDLERIGARVAIEDAAESPADRSAGVSLPPATRTPPAGTVTAKPQASTNPSWEAGVPRSPAPRTTLPPRTTPAAGSRTTLPPRTTPAAGVAPPRVTLPPMQSGLAAAFSDAGPAPSMAALDAPGLSLSSVDGRDPSSAAFEPPGNFDAPDSAAFDAAAEAAPTIRLPPGTKPGKPAAAAAKADRPKDIPLDLFAPPDAGDQDFAVELAADELAHQARKRASAPVPLAVAPPAPAATSGAPARPSSPVLQPRARPSIDPANVPVATVVRPPLARGRFAAGVLVAVVLGFVPAHVIASVRERSAFREVDDHVTAFQASPDAQQLDDAALDAFRSDQRDRKQSSRRSIALASLAIWALLGGGIAYVWFRRVPWDRLARPR